MYAENTIRSVPVPRFHPFIISSLPSFWVMVIVSKPMNSMKPPLPIKPNHCQLIHSGSRLMIMEIIMSERFFFRMSIKKGGSMVPGYKNKLTIRRLHTAICHVMCDYCIFDCDKCLANRKNLLLKFITDNFKPIK